MLLLLFIVLFILLLFPESAASGARNGLILWATVLVPSLLPFSVITSLIRQNMQGKPYHYLLLAAGILSGYPIGAKIAGELHQDGILSRRKALFFAGFTNNPSPMFIIFFVGENMLHLGTGKYLFYLLVLISSLIGSLCFTLLFLRPSQPDVQSRFPETSFCGGTQKSLSRIIDAEIASSALLLIKIGGYVMIFSIFTTLLGQISFFPEWLSLLLGGALEITTGNAMISQAVLPEQIKIILSLAATAFGGLSAAAQTYSVLQNTGLTILPYVGMKFISSITALVLGFLLFL